MGLVIVLNNVIKITNATHQVIEVENGAPVVRGVDGKDGHTPIKGTDYWTLTDKQEIVLEVVSILTGRSQLGTAILGTMILGKGV